MYSCVCMYVYKLKTFDLRSPLYGTKSSLWILHQFGPDYGSGPDMTSLTPFLPHFPDKTRFSLELLIRSTIFVTLYKTLILRVTHDNLRETSHSLSPRFLQRCLKQTRRPDYQTGICFDISWSSLYEPPSDS